MIIKQTFFNHIKVLWITIFTTLLYFLGWWYFGFKDDFFLIFLGFYILTVVPSFFLHISYYLRNKGMVCEILPDRIRIEKEGKEETVIASSDIQEVVVYKSASMDAGGIPITPMEAYFFVRIFDKNNKRYDLTCLMDTNIDRSIRTIQGVKIFKERGLFNI